MKRNYNDFEIYAIKSNLNYVEKKLAGFLNTNLDKYPYEQFKDDTAGYILKLFELRNNLQNLIDEIESSVAREDDPRIILKG